MFTGSVSLLGWYLKAKGKLGYNFRFFGADEWNFMTNGNMIDISNIPYSVARNSIGEKSVKVDIEISTFVSSEKLVTCFLRWLAFMLHGFHVSIKEASHHDLCFF